MIALLLVVSLTAPPSGYQPAGQPAAGSSMAQFIATLQRAVSRNDRQAVAGMVSYPLEVRAGTLQIPVADSAAFVKLYESLITSGMKSVISRARVPAGGQKSASVTTGSNGALTFEGALTIAPAGGGFKITQLTVPPSAPQSSSPGVAVARHLTFKVGTPTQVSGTLMPGGADRYEFHGEQGVFVDVRLSGVPGRTVLLHIVDSKTGKAVDARADAGTRVWTGRLPAASQYRIEVVRQPDNGTEPLIYTMAIVLK
jgi:hypothetical protein